MDVRTLLGRISYNKALARELREQIEAMYAGLLPHGLRYDKDNVQASGNDHTAEILDNIETMRINRQSIIDKAEQDEKLALEIIDGVREIDSREATVLTMYYLRSGRDTFADIADEIGYSERQVMRIQDSAIKHAQEILDRMEDGNMA